MWCLGKHHWDEAGINVAPLFFEIFCLLSQSHLHASVLLLVWNNFFASETRQSSFTATTLWQMLTLHNLRLVLMCDGQTTNCPQFEFVLDIWHSTSPLKSNGEKNKQNFSHVDSCIQLLVSMGNRAAGVSFMASSFLACELSNVLTI